MVQEMPTPIVTRDQYKAPMYMINLTNGGNATPEHAYLPQNHTGCVVNASTPMPSPAHLPMPMSMMPMQPHMHPFFQVLGHPPLPLPRPSGHSTPGLQHPSPLSVFGAAPSSQGYCDYMYHTCFLQGMFSDVTLTVPRLQKSYALHSFALSQSPVLYRKMLNLFQQHLFVLELDLAISPEALHAVVGCFYRPFSQQDLCFLVTETPHLGLELLEAACELELDALEHQVMSAIDQTMSQNLLYYWIAALRPWLGQTRGWAETLEQNLILHLISDLPQQLEAFSTSGGGSASGSSTEETHVSPKEDTLRINGHAHSPNIPRGTADLARVYAGLPLDYLKRCLEHTDLEVHDTLERYAFAKQVLHIRKQMGRCEESVVLSFSQNKKDTGIVIVKKQGLKKGRWDPSQHAKDMEKD